MSEDKPKRKWGGPQPGAGRPTKAEEFGLHSLMLRAWPESERENNIRHIASFIGNMETYEGKFGPIPKIDPKVQVSALELLLKYGYGTPKAIDVTMDFDPDADLEKMTDEELRLYEIKVNQYLAKRGIKN
jgi:hypothetical protein